MWPKIERFAQGGHGFRLNYRKIAKKTSIMSPRPLRNLSFFLIPLLSSFGTQAQSSLEDEVYALYSKDGVRIGFDEAISALVEADVVLFGELHNDALIHWLQLRTVKALDAKKPLTLGGEMFENDGQIILDEYLKGMMSDKVFEDQMRLWTNYKTDYKPLVEYAKAEGIPFIATNVPRRYASLVSRHGLDTLAKLPKASQVFLPALPIPFSFETPGYEDMRGMMAGGHGMPFEPDNFVKAQAIKDATMADNIQRHAGNGRLFVHFNGDFHSASYGGIFWYLTVFNPDLQVKTIKVFNDKNLGFQDEWAGSGDVILVVPEDFTKTH